MNAKTTSETPAKPVIHPEAMTEALRDLARRAAALAPMMAEKQAADLESSLQDEFGVQKADRKSVV